MGEAWSVAALLEKAEGKPLDSPEVAILWDAAIESGVQARALELLRPSRGKHPAYEPDPAWLGAVTAVVLFGDFQTEPWPAPKRRYGRLVVYEDVAIAINGRLLADNATARIKSPPDERPIFSIARGLAGFNAGRVGTEVEITNAVLLSRENAALFDGFIREVFDDHAPCELAILPSSPGVEEPRVFRGVVTASEEHHRTRGDPRLGFTFRGEERT